RTRWLVTLKRCRRESAALAPARPAPAAPKRKGGHPGNRTRNDHLLVLYEATPPDEKKMARCRMVARTYAAEIARDKARDPAREWIMPAATVRDAVAEALRHRAAAATTKRSGVDEQPVNTSSPTNNPRTG